MAKSQTTMRILVWLATLVLLGAATFTGYIGHFEHFWGAWEFFAAASAAAYNAFALAVFVLPHAKYGALDDLIKGGWKLVIGVLRFATPVALFLLITTRLLPDQHVLNLHWDLGERLFWTTSAFASMLLGDAVTIMRLRRWYTSASIEHLAVWREELTTLVVYVHLPFIMSYGALLTVYYRYRHHADGIALEAFVAGAAAFEVIVQNTIHATASFRAR